jgi:hypothetical protein
MFSKYDYKTVRELLHSQNVIKMVKIKIGMAIRASPIVYNKRLIGN